MDASRGLSRRQVIGGAAAAGVAVTAGVGPRSLRPSAHADTTLDADVVVVGAGLAGLSTARQLVAAGRSVVVLEARDRVGGRTFNHTFANGRVSDVGGTWVGPTQDHIRALARQLGVTEFPQPDAGNAVYYHRGRRTTYNDHTPVLGTAPPDPEIVADVAVIVGLLDQMAAETPVDKPWNAPQAAAWDRQTLWSWLSDHSISSKTMKIASSALEALVGAEARDISLLFTVAYIARATNGSTPGTFERLINTRGGAQAARFVEGAYEISVRMAAALGDRVHLSAPVRRIEHSATDVTVVADGLTAHGKHVVVAIPPTLTGRIVYSPLLPATRDLLAQRMPQGWIIKVAAYYDTPWWRERGLNGFALSDVGPARTTFDISPRDNAFGGLLGFVGGDEARAWSGDQVKLRNAVLSNLAAYFGKPALKPRAVVIQDWAAEEWTRGCPVASAGPGVVREFTSTISDPVGRIHWAGTETATYWQGYMDGAVRSGERAAAEVLAAL